MLTPTRGFASAGGCEIGATVLFVEDGSGECCVSFLSARIAVEMDQSSCIWINVENVLSTWAVLHNPGIPNTERRRSLETKGKKLLREFPSTAVLDFQGAQASSGTQSLCAACGDLLAEQKEAVSQEVEEATALHNLCTECQPASNSPDTHSDSETEEEEKVSGKERRTRVVEQLRSGRSPMEILEGMSIWRPPEFWAVVDFLSAHGQMAKALEVFQWWRKKDRYRPREAHFNRFIRMLGASRMCDEAQDLFDEMQRLGIKPTTSTYTCLLQCYAECGLFEQSEGILKQMITSGDAKPNTVTYTGLLHAYGKKGLYDQMWRIFNNMITVGIPPDELTYRSLVQNYARGGLFQRMNKALREMISKGIQPDSTCMNYVVRAYAQAGLVREMERHYSILREYEFNATRQTLRAVARAYLRNSNFYQLGQFVQSVGLRKPSIGNLLWNALLLSYAANFSMKNLEREFENMKQAGFAPDLTTYNILALAYSRMEQFWNLRVTVLEMQSSGVAPDLVTYGAVVDAFVAFRLQSRLPEALKEMRTIDLVAEMRTDSLVLEVFGKGDFYIACEDLVHNMQGVDLNLRTYANLIGFYLETLEKQSPRLPKER
ncbi:unnamed protein product [Sphagnum jensenii]